MMKVSALLNLVLVAVSGFAIMQRSSIDEMTYILDVAWSPGGEHIAVVGAYPGEPNVISTGHGYLSVIDGISGNTLFSIEPPSAFTSVAWSPDGQRLAVGSFDSTIWIVDAGTGKRITNLYGHQATVTDVDWNSSGTQIVSSGNWDRLVILWETNTYAALFQYETNAHPYSVEFAVDDSQFAVGTEAGLYTWFVDAEKNNVQSPEPPIVNDWIYHLAYSRDGRYLAAGTIAPVSFVTGLQGPAFIYIIDTATGSTLDRLVSTSGSVGGLSWDIDNQRLAVLNEENTMTVWNIEVGTIDVSYPSFGAGQYAKGGVDFSPYGGRLAFGTSFAQAAAPASSPGNNTLLPDGTLQIIVPDPTLDRLNAIAELCFADTPRTVPPVEEVDALPDFVTQIEALPDDAFPHACRADLLAVADAIMSGRDD
jgi:WD40 repeat protein